MKNETALFPIDLVRRDYYEAAYRWDVYLLCVLCAHAATDGARWCRFDHTDLAAPLG